MNEISQYFKQNVSKDASLKEKEDVLLMFERKYENSELSIILNIRLAQLYKASYEDWESSFSEYQQKRNYYDVTPKN